MRCELFLNLWVSQDNLHLGCDSCFSEEEKFCRKDFGDTRRKDVGDIKFLIFIKKFFVLIHNLTIHLKCIIAA